MAGMCRWPIVLARSLDAAPSNAIAAATTVAVVAPAAFEDAAAVAGANSGHM